MDTKGFTLIELLVTVAIVAILTAVALPEFQEYRKRAFRATMASDFRNLISAVEVYFADNPENDFVSCGDSL